MDPLIKLIRYTFHKVVHTEKIYVLYGHENETMYDRWPKDQTLITLCQIQGCYLCRCFINEGWVDGWQMKQAIKETAVYNEKMKPKLQLFYG